MCELNLINQLEVQFYYFLRHYKLDTNFAKPE